MGLCEPLCIHVLACLFTLVLACASHNVCMCLVCGDAWISLVLRVVLYLCAVLANMCWIAGLLVG